MRCPRTMMLRSVLLAGAVAAAGLLTFGCDEDEASTGTGAQFIAILCELSRNSVPAGSAQGVLVGGLVTSNGMPAGGQTVIFTSSIGDMVPDSVVTGVDGRATSTFIPPATPGSAVITTTVSQGGVGVASTACNVAVSGSTDPRLSVSLVAPQMLAGLTVRVTYNAAILDVAPGGVQAVGALADGAAGCVSQANDTGLGTVTLVMACPMIRSAGGAEVGRFTFDSSGTVQVLSDFTVQCTGVDLSGSPVGTVCTAQVTQI
jgi:hypothetical protein